jgi:hypothetical protein
MSDPGAGNYLDGAAAHPYLEGELQLLPAPDLHAVIVVTKLSKPFLSKTVSTLINNSDVKTFNRSINYLHKKYRTLTAFYPQLVNVGKPNFCNFVICVRKVSLKSSFVDRHPFDPDLTSLFNANPDPDPT